MTYFTLILGSLLTLGYAINLIEKGYALTYTLILIGLILGCVIGITSIPNYYYKGVKLELDLILIMIVALAYLIASLHKLIGVIGHRVTMLNVEAHLRVGLFICSYMLAWEVLFAFKKITLCQPDSVDLYYISEIQSKF